MPITGGLPPRLDQQVHATRQAAAAALAGGMIAASGHPHNAEEAKAVFEDVYWTLFPDPEDDGYKAWTDVKHGEADRAAHKNEYEA